VGPAVTRVLVVGGGRMGGALVGGLLRSGWISPGDLAVADEREQARHELAHRYEGIVITDRVIEAGSAVLAVKPHDAERAARALAKVGPPPRVASIVAGVTIAQLESWLGPGTAVLRAMPNLPAVLGGGASAVAGGESAGEEDFAWAEAVLSSVGVVARVPEALLDAVTGLSGSGPAYILVLVEAMIEAGVEQGLDREVSALLVTHTLLGTAKLLTETGEPPTAIRAAVTSPGGTTAAGVRMLEERGFRSAVMAAVAAAAAKSVELGREEGS
jgi:pyrroline-5-carboxylate reductase